VGCSEQHLNGPEKQDAHQRETKRRIRVRIFKTTPLCVLPGKPPQPHTTFRCLRRFGRPAFATQMQGGTFFLQAFYGGYTKTVPHR
jgi:hypothetical protein